MSNAYDLYPPIVSVVRGYCKMYRYMEVSVNDPLLPLTIRQHYAVIIDGIHRAIQANCLDGEAAYFIDDIGQGTGFNKSQMCFISEHDYKSRKRKIVHDIAVNLNLV